MSYPDHSETDRRGAPLPVHDRVGLRVLALGAVRLNQSWSFQTHCDPYWRLYLNKQDGARLVVDGEPFPLDGRRIYLIPAWVGFATRPSEGVEHIYCHFDLPGLPGPLLRRLFDAPFQVEPVAGWVRQLIAIGDELAARRRVTPRIVGDVKGIIDAAIGRRLDAMPGESHHLYQQSLQGMGPIRPALDLIERAPAGDCSNEALGRACACSPDHLIRLFRRHLGQTPGQYVAERRVSWSARLLAFGDESIDAIAARAGFANRNYFTRVFTRHLGVPPATYRKMNG